MCPASESGVYHRDLTDYWSHLCFFQSFITISTKEIKIDLCRLRLVRETVTNQSLKGLRGF